MTYRVVHVLYAVTGILVLLGVLEFLREQAGILPQVDEALASEMAAVVMTFVIGGLLLVGMVAWLVAAVIIWKFRRDWKAILPAAILLLAYLVAVLMVSGGDVDEALARLLAVIMVLYGLSAGWVAWYWYRNGYPQ